MTSFPRDLHEGLYRSPNPVYATDERNRIVAWSRAVEQLLGHPAHSAVGRECHALVGGTDAYGNEFCDRECSVVKMVRRNRVVRQFDMEARRASGEPVRVHCAILVVPGSSRSRFTIIHVLEPAAGDATGQKPPERSPIGEAAPPARSSGGARARLTPREREVLRVLATGAGTREIAKALFVSPSTVRTHVRNLLQKMQVHSRLEAVLAGLRQHDL